MGRGTIVDLGRAALDTWYPRPVFVVDTDLIRSTNPDLTRPERVPIHLVLVPSRGHGFHTVDFATVQVELGTAVHVRPGQVQQWHADQSFAARVVGIRAEAVPAGVADPRNAPTVHRLGESRAVVDALVVELGRVTTIAGTDPLCVSLALALLHVVCQSSEPSAGSVTTSSHLRSRFLDLVEGDHALRRSVDDYARQLGVSPRTLTRIIRTTDGRSAKQVIDDRVALEARRLLSHTDDPVAAIGRRLGFTDASNFATFVRRRTGSTPTTLRGIRAASLAGQASHPE